MRKKFAIFGANGFIGSNLVDRLSRSAEVKAVDLYHKPATFEVNRNVKIIKSNLAEGDKIIADIGADKLDGIVWAVGGLIPADELGDEVKVFEIIEPTIRLMKAFIERKIPIILTSSAGMLYSQRKVPLGENDKVDPWTWYGLQKLVIEKSLRLLSRSANNNLMKILRITSVYGERQPTDRDQGVIAKLFRSAIKKEPFVLYGSENARRDYVYVGDLAKIIEIFLTKETEYPMYNVSTGSGKTLKEVRKIIENITGNKIKIIRKDKRDIDPSHIDVSNRRLLKELKRFQFADLEEGLKKTYYWFEKSL
ncbi:MAG: hypothetical protein A2Y57_01595 [Candidatus Woykebacteria bacterium RBG_13_40_7b]|uniref:NAD-dependent epimerase/dehydratase domain-containing protein n=1 Tax=Candidatus Woykebacteria bacterium RBG_13_40_7b TaxID=1802594 RepID=A0A1G1W776_9BACT|nr:MAG: hypothetical protein A2Y57_01595 [Candidatus Woykebacteria bacterium RBG_13_40_7b]